MRRKTSATRGTGKLIAAPVLIHRNLALITIITDIDMATKQPGPHIPSEGVASQLEKPKGDTKTLKKEHVEAKPGPVILSEEHANTVEAPLSKEELQKKAKEMNQ
jgi:hypothetical protein